ncbi:aminotransferase A [Gracilibacillus halophilus YIM-C55.5]|uniref:Aminotransferase n=1 Tax=Gracilibacillus halophilus YIM-C55.5 TaxID=1308866 RepID=N4WD59_9BACI|nr:aminotransferase A [Gracilibacillus halophilus]ENH97199.1 aminotransferase A [Gracilibacillus halophilus YIM-C55.5]
MEHRINPQVKQLQISGIRQFFNMVTDEKDVLSLTIGQPDFPTPDHIKDSTKAAITQNKTSYTHNAGILPLREAIAHFYREKYHVSFEPTNEVIVTVGASQALDVTLRTILSPGDEVIIPGPVYPGYEPLIRLSGATPIHVDTREHQFKLTAELIEQAITENTKCVLIPYPSNPTGASLTKKELGDIAHLIYKHRLFMIADEIYSELVYTQSHHSIGQFDIIRDQTIIINGVSKSHAMTGFRVGYILAPHWLQKHMLKVHQYNVSCASSISQQAAYEALTTGKNDAHPMRDAYQKRRDFVYQKLQELNLASYLPDGAFYYFIDVRHLQQDSFSIAIDLVKQAKVALVPGSAFSAYGEGFLRLSYAYHLDTLAEGLNRMETFLKKP